MRKKSDEMHLPNTPIKRRTLQAVIIPEPKRATLTRYVMTNGEKYARFDQLTAREKEIVLEFLLRYAPPFTVERPKARTRQDETETAGDAITGETFDTSGIEKLLEGLKGEEETEGAGDENNS